VSVTYRRTSDNWRTTFSHMGLARRLLAGALLFGGTLSACGGTDGDDPIRSAVLDCIADGGGEVGADADVAMEGGRAMAVMGDVQASEALLASCLDRATE
jgi:hypothetical protein